MRYVERAPTPPVALGGSLASERRQSFLRYLQLDSIKREQTRVPIMQFETKEILRDLAHMFLGKCAFCEQTSKSMYVHRFRPMNDAEPIIGSEEDGGARDAHLYYGWLSDAWINLYPICAVCRPKRTNYFPVAAQRAPIPTAGDYARFVEQGDGTWPGLDLDETPLLIDPCQDDIARHLVPRQDGSLEAASPQGEETIRHFRLNRTRLRTKRKQAFDDYAKLSGDGPNDTHEFVGLWRILRRQSDADDAEMAAISASANIVEEADVAGGRPRLKEVRLTNFKAIETLSIKLPPPPDPSERLAQALLILGENAAGKSSILEAIALALIDPDARLDLVEEPGTLRLNPGFMGAEGLPQKASAKVRLLFDNGQESTLTVRAKGYAQTSQTQVPFVFGYGAYRHYVRDLHDFKPSRPVLSLFHTDSLLSNPENWLLGLSRTDYRSVVQALGVIFGATEEIDVIYRDEAKGRCYVEMQIDPTAQKKSRTPLSNVSSGFRTILALACDIMRWLMDRSVNPAFTSLISAEGIVLIDEVEAHLHPRWKIQIMKGLRTALPAMTFIVTTHDPLCLRGMRDGEVVVLSKVARTGSGEIPVMVDRLTQLPKVSALTIEQLLTSDLFSLFSTDDPETEASLAKLGDYLSKKDGSLPDQTVKAAMDAIRRQVVDALPVGMSEAARLVQEAVADYLVKRRNLAGKQREDLREETKTRILNVLEAF
ncbi:hypothetical protein EHS39_17660 [Ensifer sp. MPMI2T]|nr:hypothetical protein EHS39_17660 [Ensifer sp. MPMI2T]